MINYNLIGHHNKVYGRTMIDINIEIPYYMTEKLRRCDCDLFLNDVLTYARMHVFVDIRYD